MFDFDALDEALGTVDSPRSADGGASGAASGEQTLDCKEGLGQIAGAGSTDRASPAQAEAEWHNHASFKAPGAVHRRKALAKPAPKRKFKVGPSGTRWAPEDEPPARPSLKVAAMLAAGAHYPTAAQNVMKSLKEKAPPPKKWTGLGGLNPESNARLVCFIASHISNEERAERFEETLATIACQEPIGPPEVFVSWSASNNKFRERTRDLLVRAVLDIPKLHLLEQKGSQSQFQHLAACSRAAKQALNGMPFWVFFGDDDDLWHPRRYLEFLRAAQEIHARQSPVWCIGACSHARLVNPEAPRARSAADVDALLRDEEATQAETFTEYFDCAVKVKAFDDFLAESPPQILGNRFCDRRWVGFIFCAPKGEVRWFYPRDWLYFYSRCDGITRVGPGDYEGGASFGVEVSNADKDWALDALQASRNGSGHLAGMTGPDLSFLKANLTLAMEERAMGYPGKMLSTDLKKHSREAAKERWALYEVASDKLRDWVHEVAFTVSLEVCDRQGILVDGKRGAAQRLGMKKNPR